MRPAGFFSLCMQGSSHRVGTGQGSLPTDVPALVTMSQSSAALAEGPTLPACTTSSRPQGTSDSAGQRPPKALRSGGRRKPLGVSLMETRGGPATHSKGTPRWTLEERVDTGGEGGEAAGSRGGPEAPHWGQLGALAPPPAGHGGSCAGRAGCLGLSQCSAAPSSLRNKK